MPEGLEMVRIWPAAQLSAAADRVPCAGPPAEPARDRFRCLFCASRHVEARGPLSRRTLGAPVPVEDDAVASAFLSVGDPKGGLQFVAPDSSALPFRFATSSASMSVVGSPHRMVGADAA